MPDRETALGWIGQHVADVYGALLGKIEDVYADARTGEPVWLVVRIGRFGDDHAPVPAFEAVFRESTVFRDSALWVPYDRQAVRAAAALWTTGPLTRERDLALAAHYELHGPRQDVLEGVPPASVTCVSALAGGEPVERS